MGIEPKTSSLDRRDCRLRELEISELKVNLIFKAFDMFPEKDLHKVGNKISQPGDIAFTSKGTVGRFIFVKENMQRFVYSPQISFWRVLDCTEIEPRFYYFGCVEGNLANRFTV